MINLVVILGRIVFGANWIEKQFVIRRILTVKHETICKDIVFIMW